MHEADVAIVGAGPIGIEVAAALAADAHRLAHLEAGQIGSTMAWWSPGTRYFSSPERIEIAGVPLITAAQEKATREEYLDYLRQVAGVHRLTIHTHTRVTDARREGDAFILTTRPSTHGVGGPAEVARAAVERDDIPDGPPTLWRARAVVLAIGNMHRPRTLGVPGEALPHVSHYLPDPRELAGRRVLIVGGKNSAVEAAIRLHRVGARVTIAYRRARFDADRIKYWLLPELEWLIRKGKIGFAPLTVPEVIRPSSVTLRRVEGEPAADPRAADVHDRQQEAPLALPALNAPAPDTAALDPGQRVDLPAGAVLVLTGYTQDPDLFDRLGVALEGPEQRPVFNPRTMQTNTPGVYVAGTACGGSQLRATSFIETSHAHAPRIAAALRGLPPPEDEAPAYGPMAES